MSLEHDWQKVLQEAASIVEAGWCQGAMHLDKDGGHVHDGKEADQSCATGALERAFSQLKPDHYVAPEALFDAAGALGEHLDPKMEGMTWLRIAKWNDHPDQTAGEVAEVMRQAATA